MANEEHLKILKQGVRAWNKWRLESPDIRPGLRCADLRFLNLSNTNFSHADLISANLSGTKLRGANLSGADLSGANLSGADLRSAILRSAFLSRTLFMGADLGRTVLIDAHFSGALLSGANFSAADLSGTIFSNMSIQDVDLTNTILNATVFVGIYLFSAKGLGSVRHKGPSTISIERIYEFGGQVPEAFLRGCGLSDWQIENTKLFAPGLSNEDINNVLYRIHDLRVHQAVQIKPLFISYSHSDNSFVDIIEPHLNKHGIRFWRDIHHATAGRLERQIDQAIHSHPVVLLILSAHSVGSGWVQHEARLARKLEQETKSDVLCPIALDDTWKSCDWPERLREQIMEYNILDFSQWQDQSQFDRVFTKLVDGLAIFYK